MTRHKKNNYLGHNYKLVLCCALIMLFVDDVIVSQVVDLSGNTISSLHGLEGHAYLTEINMEDNKVSIFIITYCCDACCCMYLHCMCLYITYASVH